MDAKQFKTKVTKLKTELTKIYSALPEEKKPVAEKLIDELAFMIITLQTLKEDIAEVGAVELFENGSQVMRRENPALKSYTALINRFTALLKELNGLTPIAEIQEDTANKTDEMVKLMLGGYQIEKR